MAARASFSSDSRIMKVPLPNSILLKDYLLDDLSSCSSNGFRSYPRRQCFTKVRYLIEIDLNKHIKLPPTQKNFLKSKSKSNSKSKSSLVLQKASAAVVNCFKHFRFSGSGKPAKPKFLPKINLSRKLSKSKRTTDRHHNKTLNSFDEPVKEKKNRVLTPRCKVSTATAVAEVNSNSSASTDSYFSITTTTSVSSTTNNSCSKVNVAQNDAVKEREKHATKVGVATAIATATTTATSDSAVNGNAKIDEQREKKEQFSPVSVMDFPCDNDYNHDDDDEVTSPFQHSHLYAEGTKGKLLKKVQRIKSLARLTPVRLEDRITLSESTTTVNVLHEESSNPPQRKAIALLQQLKGTMSSHNYNQLESKMTQNVLLGFFIEEIVEGKVSNFGLLQEAKDWINGHVRDPTFECQNNKLTYIRDMEKGKAKWSTYDDQVQKQDIVFELECQVFMSLVEEMLCEFYL